MLVIVPARQMRARMSNISRASVSIESGLPRLGDVGADDWRKLVASACVVEAREEMNGSFGVWDEGVWRDGDFLWRRLAVGFSAWSWGLRRLLL